MRENDRIGPGISMMPYSAPISLFGAGTALCPIALACFCAAAVSPANRSRATNRRAYLARSPDPLFSNAATSRS